jgi:predicted glycosyl hydrolase (DUF1957 family)
LRHIRRSIWQGRVARNKTRELLKIAASNWQFSLSDLVALAASRLNAELK